MVNAGGTKSCSGVQVLEGIMDKREASRGFMFSANRGHKYDRAGGFLDTDEVRFHPLVLFPSGGKDELGTFCTIVITAQVDGLDHGRNYGPHNMW